MPTDLTEYNFKDLLKRYRDGTDAVSALRLVNQPPPDGLVRLLRNHVDVPIVDAEEIRLRRAFDQLLSFYSLMEVASLGALVPVRLPDDFVHESLKCLQTPAVRYYHEQAYPLTLPVLFRLRLERKWNESEEPSAQAQSFCYQFLELHDMLNGSESAQTFLWLLEDGIVNGQDLSDALLVALNDPQILFTHLQKPPPQQEPVDRSLHGMGTFMDFCVALDDLLQQVRDWERLQSAFWHYYAYWFRNLASRVGSRFRPALKALSRWQEFAEAEDAHAAHDYFERVNAATKRLVTGHFGARLDNVVARLLGETRRINMLRRDGMA